MSKKKFVCILLALVLISTALFSACAMFEKDVYLSSQETAFTVGNQKVSVSSFSTVYSNLYNTYYYYIMYGYMTEADLISRAYLQLVYTNAFIDHFKKTAEEEDHEYADLFEGARYLPKEHVEYAIKYAKYNTYATIENLVLGLLAKNHTFLEEESSARDMFTREIIESLSNKTFPLSNEAMEEFLGNYNINLNYKDFDDDYVFSIKSTDETELKNIEEQLKKINAKLDTDDADYILVTKEEYIKAQKEALTTFKSRIKSNYGILFDKFMKMQIEEAINSVITMLYQNQLSYSILEEDKDELFTRLNALWQSKKQAAQDKYLIDPSLWSTDIEALTDSSFIYDSSAEYNYVYVKNLLIPFSEGQAAELSVLKTAITDLEKGLSSATTEEKVRIGAQIAQLKTQLEEYKIILANQILAKDYLDSEANNKNFFEIVDGKIAVSAASDLYKGFTDSKGDTVKGLKDISSSQDFIDLMARYNTDTAQHTARYDYVVNVTPKEDYTPKWVTEFVDCVKETVFGADSENPDDLGDNIGNYGVTVSDYGVHIVYYSGDVVAQEPNFEGVNADGDLLIYDTSTTEYRFMSLYFNEVYSAFLSEQRDEILQNTTIKLRSYMKKLIKDYDITLPDVKEQ